jgi:hypothetical protein
MSPARWTGDILAMDDTQMTRSRRPWGPGGFLVSDDLSGANLVRARALGTLLDLEFDTLAAGEAVEVE